MSAGPRAGSVYGIRTMAVIPKRPGRRRSCPCCGRPITHTGFGDGLALMSGCMFLVMKWVKDPATARRMMIRGRQ